MEKIDALSAMSALAHETRLNVFRLLVVAGPAGMAAGRIGDELGVRQNTMSANLAQLEATGLITRKRHGRSIRYFANFARMHELLEFLIRDCCQGAPQIANPLAQTLSHDCC